MHENNIAHPTNSFDISLLYNEKYTCTCAFVTFYSDNGYTMISHDIDAEATVFVKDETYTFRFTCICGQNIDTDETYVTLDDCPGLYER